MALRPLRENRVHEKWVRPKREKEKEREKRER
jgi:hypothetical protein